MYECSKYIFDKLFCVDALLKCNPVKTSQSLVDCVQGLHYALVRGDVPNSAAMTVGAMRNATGQDASLGAAGQITWRMLILRQLLETYNFCDAIKAAYDSWPVWNKNFPSENQLQAAARESRVINSNAQQWISQLQTHIDVEGHPILTTK